MVRICNGRYDEDKGVGHYTFTGPNGNSVIGSVWGSPNGTIGNFTNGFTGSHW